MVKDLKEGIADMENAKKSCDIYLLNDMVRNGNEKEVDKLERIFHLSTTPVFLRKSYEGNEDAKELRDLLIKIANIVSEK